MTASMAISLLTIIVALNGVALAMALTSIIQTLGSVSRNLSQIYQALVLLQITVQLPGLPRGTTDTVGPVGVSDPVVP